ncbi:uncharacterized protein LOC113518542 [Galleria mellonella]|uniref:Uncharacterized protein LOC113518542 n=1 Tax=Galleria mellonella TaxID=7137 RepID=A0A6J1X1B7_GALME|nr:uncharacterized protein LOC113518542 [Galleria mellonella]
MYAQNSARVGLKTFEDENLPRTYIHSIYKFGWCTPDAIAPQFLRKTANITFPTWQSTQVNYIYLLENKNTQRFHLQCIIMKFFVPRKFMFKRGRFPMYYCQGYAMVMIFNNVNKLEVHEFYIQYALDMPTNIAFEFYHPTPL